ncbi:MAG TPA: serine/threonine-protein kinase [Streptosporangiaceae bacterium]|nr:serine/threonine-protein kinase [Streptosporangiaceae bacterium]
MPQPVLTEPLRRWDPEQIGGYTLIGRLGAGAMGQVYLGLSAAGRLVAVKTIKIELAEEPDFRTRFAQEVAAARRVSGAFTAAVVAADPEADMPWLATAYVPAPSLSTLVRACGPLPVPAVRWLGAGCAEALESIHGTGLVHRDLKPSNVLVSPDGPRVIDFGVARAAERIQLTVTRGAVGTPAYMAPEQARDTRQATVASDVFSLGATMLFAATGHAPYQGETVMDLLVRLATEPPDLTGLPAELADIVRPCLERDPRKRPTSAAVLAHLAPDISPSDPGQSLGSSALPGPALALIAEYRRDPQPRARGSGGDGPGSDPGSASGSGDDATFGSQPPLSAPGRAPAPSSRHRPPSRRARTRRRRVYLAIWTTAAAAVLLGAGTAIGLTVGGSDQQPLPPPPVNTILVPASQASLSAQQAGRPQIALYQGFGDSHTVFVLHGEGWKPGQPVTVSLSGRVSPAHPIVDEAGTFSYAINQDHEFFRGGLPAGIYQVVVTAPGGARATASFTVHAGLPPGQPPAGGPAVTSPGSTTGPPGGNTKPGHRAAKGHWRQ